MIIVIICTYNRARSLRRTLVSLAQMEVPADLSWELIVVDNNSSDHTRAVVAEFAQTSGLPVCNYSLPLDSIKPAANTTPSVECVLRFQANLLRGAYTIHLPVRHFPSSEQLAVVINAAFFSVEERVSHEGVAHLNPFLVANQTRGQ